MRVIQSWQEAIEISELKGGAITVGNFDGVHMGHEQVLAELRGHALAVGGPSILVTFEPHPRAVLYPQEAPRRLCHMHEKLQYLEDAGIDAVLLLEFNKELSTWPSEKILLHPPRYVWLQTYPCWLRFRFWS